MDPIALNLWAFVLVFGAVHGFGLSALLFRRPGAPRRARLCLAWLSLVIALLLVDYAVMIGGLNGRWPVASQLFDPLWYFVGPLFYGYIRFLLPGRDRWTPEDVLHFLPLALVLFATVTALFMSPEAVAAAQAVPMAESRMFAVFITLYLLQSASYAYITTALVGDYARGYRQEASGETAVQLEGLQRLLLVFWVYVGMTAVNVVLLLSIGLYSMKLDYLVPLTLAGLVYVLGYLRLRSPEQLLPPLRLPSAPAATPSAPTPELLGHADRLRALMATERLYLNPDLRLSDLAAPLGIAERTLSQVFSEALAESFYDFVNGYRVEEVKARLPDPAFTHLTVLGIAMESGFSSKASFNRVFKKVTGMTPTAYRERAPYADAASAAGDGALPTLRVAATASSEDEQLAGQGPGERP